MMNNHLFEKRAKELGHDVTVDWRDYPSAQPMVEAFVSNNLDLGMWGNTPIIRGLAAKQPWMLLNIGEGHMRLVLATRPGSPIRNVQDLKGKTVGVLLGGDPYNVLAQLLLTELGSGNPKDFNISVVNVPTQAQAATVPRGMDAAVVIYPFFLQAQKEVGTVGIVNSYGLTEAYYDGPAGTGAGHLLPNARKSPFYPDGVYIHRSFWMAREAVMTKTPWLVTAFLAAQQDAVGSLAAKQPGAVSDLVKKYWNLPPDLGAKVVEDELLFQRGWVWATEGDANGLVQLSKFMVDSGMVTDPLPWNLVLENLAKSAPLAKQAYQMTGSKPDEAAFTTKDAKDVRGLPSWEFDRWAKH